MAQLQPSLGGCLSPVRFMYSPPLPVAPTLSDVSLSAACGVAGRLEKPSDFHFPKINFSILASLGMISEASKQQNTGQMGWKGKALNSGMRFSIFQLKSDIGKKGKKRKENHLLLFFFPRGIQ